MDMATADIRHTDAILVVIEENDADFERSENYK